MTKRPAFPRLGFDEKILRGRFLPATTPDEGVPLIATAKSSPRRPPFSSRSGRSRSEEDAGSRDCAYGTYAPPHCGSGSPASRLPRFAGVREPLDGSHKTLTSFGAPASLAVADQSDDASRVGTERDSVASPRRGSETNCLINGEPRGRPQGRDPARSPRALEAGGLRQFAVDADEQGGGRPVQAAA